MKHLALLLFAASAFGQTVATIAEAEFLSPIGPNRKFRGTITATPARNCRMTRDGRSFAGQTAVTFCVGLGPNGAATPAPSNCEVTSPEGVLSMELNPTGAGTQPEGCFYNVNLEYRRRDGTTVKDTETWVVPSAGTFQVKDVRVPIPPTPSANFRLTQIKGNAGSVGCLEKQANGDIIATLNPCGTGSGGGGVPPANATWSTVTGTWGTNNRPWSSQ